MNDVVITTRSAIRELPKELVDRIEAARVLDGGAESLSRYVESLIQIGLGERENDHANLDWLKANGHAVLATKLKDKRDLDVLDVHEALKRFREEHP